MCTHMAWKPKLSTSSTDTELSCHEVLISVGAATEEARQKEAGSVIPQVPLVPQSLSADRIGCLGLRKEVTYF